MYNGIKFSIEPDFETSGETPFHWIVEDDDEIYGKGCETTQEDAERAILDCIKSDIFHIE